MDEPIEVCNHCRQAVSHVGNDAVAFCSDHGIVEGATHFETGACFICLQLVEDTDEHRLATDPEDGLLKACHEECLQKRCSHPETEVIDDSFSYAGTHATAGQSGTHRNIYEQCVNCGKTFEHNPEPDEEA